MAITQKRIVIKSNGPIRPKSGIYGPILTPYLERIETVVTLVSQGYNVHEVLEDGTQVKLDLRNVNKDNEKVAVEAPKAQEPKQNAPVVNTGKKNKHNQQPKKEAPVDPSNKKVEDDVETK